MFKKYIILVLIFVSHSAFSNCGSDSNNDYQLANCDFDTDFTGWNTNPGSASFNAVDDFQGSMTSGSTQVSSSELVPASLNASNLIQCYDTVSDMTEKTAGAWFKSNSANPFDCKMQVQFYSGALCSLTNLGQCDSPFTTFTAATDWTNINCNAPALASNAASIRLTLSCSNGDLNGGPTDTTDPFSVLLDNAYVVPVGNLPVELMEFSVD